MRDKGLLTKQEPKTTTATGMTMINVKDNLEGYNKAGCGSYLDTAETVASNYALNDACI